jgi:hypothetical protein
MNRYLLVHMRPLSVLSGMGIGREWMNRCIVNSGREWDSIAFARTIVALPQHFR